MTQEQTRKLGIEFERRLISINPAFETINKLDTDTIYSFLSEYQIHFVNEIIALQDQVQSETIAANKISDVLKTLIANKTIPISKRHVTHDQWSDAFDIPVDYYTYLRSTSIIDKNYKTRNKTEHMSYAPNKLIMQKDVSSITGSFYNQGGILRNPMVVLESTLVNSPYIKVIHDSYTHIDAIELTYYRQPYRFNILKYDDDDMSEGSVHSTCELPFSCFDDLVEGAVQMYINYAQSTQPKQQKQERRQEVEQ